MDTPNRSTSHRRVVSASRRTVRGPLENETNDPLSPEEPPALPKRPRSPPSASTTTLQAPTSLSVKSPISPSTNTPSRGLSPAATPSSQTSMPDLPQKDFSFLQNPSTYHPLPSASPLPPFVTSPHAATSSTPLPVLLAKGHYRQAAIVSASHLLAAPSTAGPAVLALLHTRLACLCLLQEHGLAATEAKALGDLTSTFYQHPITGAHVVPWGLRVLAVRLQALGWGDGRRGIMGYYELAREAREEVRKIRERRRRRVAEAKEKENEEPGREREGRDQEEEMDIKEEQLWRTRLREVGICVANALVEMGDLEAAAGHLASLRQNRETRSDEEREEDDRLTAMECLVWLRAGDVAAARRCVEAAGVKLPLASSQSPSSPNSPDASPDTSTTSSSSPALQPLPGLLALADGALPSALASLTILTAQHPSDPLHAVNLAVARFYAGHLRVALGSITALAAGERAGMVEGGAEGKETPPFRALLFNAATLLDLCCERSRERKLALAEKVAVREPRPECGGWERGVGGELKI